MPGLKTTITSVRKPGLARPAILVVVLAILGGAWNWCLNSLAPQLLHGAAQVDGATGTTQLNAGLAGFVAQWGQLISGGLQGACLGGLAVILSGVLLRARTGKARAAAAVTMTVGAVAAEPLVFLGQWMPAGLLQPLTTKVDTALSSTAMQYVQASSSAIEGAALAAGMAFPAAILGIKGLFWLTARDTRREVWQLAVLGVPVLAAVRIGQRVIAPLPGGGVGLNLAGTDWTATGVAAACAAGGAWWALALSMPKEPRPTGDDDDAGDDDGADGDDGE